MRCTSRPTLLALALFTEACPAGKPPPVTNEPPDAGTPAPAESGRARVYQLFVRTFGNTNATNAWAGTIAENGCGTFEDVDARAIASLRDLGFTHVWLTGVLRQASLTAYPGLGLAAEDPDVVKGRAGSPYAITDYFDVSPDYARDPAKRLDEFRALVDRLHAAGLKVVIDLVPNHVARGYGSVVKPQEDLGRDDDRTKFFAPDNAFFYLVDPPGQALSLTAPEGWSVPGLDGRYAREDGSAPDRIPKATGNNNTQVKLGPGDWYETVKLNWGYDFAAGAFPLASRPRTWVKFDAILSYWQGFGVDGFRADFAHWVPAEAWKWLLAQARARDPDAFFIAEAYDAADRAPGATLPGLVAAGFDAVYDDATYDTLKGIFQGEKWANDLDAHEPPEGMRAHVVRYAENHDERRAASPLSAPGEDSGFGSGEAGLAAAEFLYLSAGGPILFHAGQELGEPGAGREGYGGEDGRTSIFDYWSVPTLRLFHLGGWSDASLPDPARTLRRRYGELLRLASEPVFGPDAGFYSLSSASRGDESFGGRGRWVTAFLRFTRDRVALVVTNFDRARGWAPKVKLPARALALAGLDGADEYSFVASYGDVESQVAPLATLQSDGLALPLPALGTGVWNVRKKP